MANEQVYYSALHWAKKAEASAKLAADLAQTEGKVIQLGFDGSMQDGQLVFKHAPGGVEVPYHLVDDVEYELDLAYNGDLDSLTTMVVKNSGDTIGFVSALHRSSTEPARVADMDAVMRHDTATGYRWLFKATFKIAPNGAKVFLLYPVVAAKDYSDKTNCITEIPQDIKLELNNGTLTLKAGSKVYAPNGKNADGSDKFDVVMITQDIIYPSLSHANADRVVFVNSSADTLNGYDNDFVFSSSTTPSPSGTTYVWYDTANNLVKVTTNSGATWITGLSLPICIGNYVNNSGFTSIDQIFNGFGYIGSTVFTLPGVKGLIPDGRNEDGSLRNIEHKRNTVTMYTFNSDATYSNITGGLKDTGGFAFYTNYRYDAENNYNMHDNEKWGVLTYCSLNVSNGVISNFSSKQTFHAVDYNDSSWVAQQAMPSTKYIDLTLGSSGTTYTAPANGWVVFGKAASGAGQFIALVTGYLVNQVVSNASGNILSIYIPVYKGKTFKANYSAGGATNSFRFIYAKGEE